MQMYGDFEGFPRIIVHCLGPGVIFHDPGQMGGVSNHQLFTLQISKISRGCGYGKPKNNVYLRGYG